MDARRSGPGLALAAAVLFGLSAPAAKALAGSVDPWMLAGLLYLGSGVGLALWREAKRLRGRGRGEAPLERRDAGWLAGAIIAGGIVGPVLLMYGLASGNAIQASLLLNLETVFTALVAWSVFREALDGRVVVGIASIVAGAAILSWQPRHPLAWDVSAALVIGACLAWALDNNLTRMVSAGDPLQIAALKGVVAGSVNIALAAWQGAHWPTPSALLLSVVVGFLGYGISLVLFVLALRQLGAARAAAYLSTAPFVGAVAGVVALHEPLMGRAVLAAILMGVGVWLFLTEQHLHDHEHVALEHAHAHVDDAHHRHAHAPGTPLAEPHAHAHSHPPMRHGHPHFPDLHHRHLH